MTVKSYILLCTVCIAQMWMSVAVPPLTVEMLVNGQVDRVRPILTSRIAPARLNKFLNSLGKMTVQGSDEFLEGHFELLATILSANTGLSEADWISISTGNRDLLTEEERNEIPADTRRSQVLRILFPKRLPRELSNILTNIMNTLHRTRSETERTNALHSYFVQTLMVASGRPQREVESWFQDSFRPVGSR